MAKSTELKPGETVDRSGQYEIRGPRGGHTGVEVTLAKGETAPPTRERRQSFVLVDPTKNKSGRG